MKLVLQLTLVTYFFISCSTSTKSNRKSDFSFNLESDLTHFKQKMTDNDTLVLWFNRSGCMEMAAERIIISKKGDSLTIKSTLSEMINNEKSSYKLVYEKKTARTDTLWKIEAFFERNKYRLEKPDDFDQATLSIHYKKQKILFYRKGLGDLNIFMKDYFETMEVLYKENGYYGILKEVE